MAESITMLNIPAFLLLSRTIIDYTRKLARIHFQRTVSIVPKVIRKLDERYYMPPSEGWQIHRFILT